MTRDQALAGSASQLWRARTPTKRDDVFSTSPSKPSPLARSVFRSPYASSPNFELENGRSPSLKQLSWYATSSSSPIRPLDVTPQSRSAPTSLARPSSAARSSRATPSQSRARVSRQFLPPALAEDDPDHSSRGPPVVLESSEGDKVYIASELFEQISWIHIGPSRATQIGIRLNHTTATLHLFVSLAYTPRPRWPALMRITPLPELIALYGLLRDLDADPLLRVTRQAIADNAEEWPWEVLEFASGLGDVELGRCALEGLAGREGDRLSRGDWDPEDAQGIDPQWMLELLRLKDRHSSLPSTSMYRTTPTTPTRTPLSPSRSVLSPSRGYESSPLRFSSGPWRPSQTPVSPAQIAMTPTKSTRLSTITPPRSARRRMVIDWEAVAREFDPPVDAA